MLTRIATSPGRLLALIGKNGAISSLLAVVIGLSAPQLEGFLKTCLPVAVGVAVFGAFLSVSYSVERSWLERHILPVAVWVLAAPCLLLGFGASMAGVEAGLIIGIVLSAVSPPSSGVPSFATLLRLSPKLALVTYVCVTAMAPIAMPALASIFGVTLKIDTMQLGLKLLAMIGGGGICALLVKQFLPYMRWLFPEQAAATGTSAAGLFLVYVL